MISPNAASFVVPRTGMLRLAAWCFVFCMIASVVQADTANGLSEFQQGRFAEAQAEWRVAAAAGDADAALFLGVVYDVGQGAPQSPAQAADWYARAASLGSVPAMFNLGVLYDIGRGVGRDPAQAAQWYERAAQQGYARAEYNLALMLQDGPGIPRDRKRAQYWFWRAAGHGVTAARSHLAGYAAPAKSALPRRAESPAMESFQQAQLALLSRKPEDIGRAAALFRVAAEHNSPLAAYDLAYCYENGIGVPRNVDEALRWYRQAASRARDEGLRSIASNSADTLARQLTPDVNVSASGQPDGGRSP